jgi:hypothetical protein
LVGPAYAGLVRTSSKTRKALLDVAQELGVPASSFATVIELESGWDAAAPRHQTGTPRGGLIQLTQGANLPGFGSAKAVWAVRAMPADQQLRQIVLPMYRRMKLPAGLSAFELYKRNILPGVASRGRDFVIARKGSSEPLYPGAKLTLGQIYSANPKFRHGKDYYTWADVELEVKGTERTAAGKWVTLSGRVTNAPVLVDAKPAEKGKPISTVTAPVGAKTLSRAISQLLQQVDKLYPQRSKASDGTWGDSEHQKRESHHNGGDAVDITKDPVHGPDLDRLAAALLKDPRTQYVIWNKRIANPDIQAGTWRPYDGTNPHTRHVHLSVRHPLRDDVRPWSLPPKATTVTVSSAGKIIPSAPRSLLHLANAWREGLVDNVRWIRIPAPGGYEIDVSSDALSVVGERLCTKFADLLEITSGPKSTILPPTRAIVDARWAAAQKMGRPIVLAPPGNPDGSENQCRMWNEKLGPLTAELLDGGWKEWILDDVDGPGKATNYGLRKADGSVIQSPGHQHNDQHQDYSQRSTLVHRRAWKNGKEVDLVDELAAGGPLGGPLSPWLWARLKGAPV